MTYGLIIAAGNQTRFDNEVPKALMQIGNRALLDINIEVMSKYCDKVYVVVSNINQFKFLKYDRLVISSGLGCGDAVFKTLNNIHYKEGDKCYLMWGDAYNSKEVYEAIPLEDGCSIPCVYEESPYVQIGEDGRILFSKYGDRITSGYHDLSLFYFDIHYLNKYLVEFRNKIWYNNKYNHKHNDEMQFLDVFNETDAKYKIIPIDNYKAFCFNTVEEFNDMKERLLNEDKSSIKS